MKSRLIALTVFVLTIACGEAAQAMYHPGVGRFTTRDPNGMMVGAAFAPRDPMKQYADGMHLYQYVRSAPTRYVDPIGTQLFVVGGTPETLQFALDTFLPMLEELCPCLKFSTERPEARGAWLAVGRNTDNKDEFCACLDQHASGCKILSDLALDRHRHALSRQPGTGSRAQPIRRGDQRTYLVLDPNQATDDVPLIQIFTHEFAHIWDYEHTFTGPNDTEPNTGRTRKTVVDGLPYAEILAVRAENQIMPEITGNPLNRTTYDGINVPDPQAPRDFGKCDCDKLFNQLAP